MRGKGLLSLTLALCLAVPTAVYAKGTLSGVQAKDMPDVVGTVPTTTKTTKTDAQAKAEAAKKAAEAKKAEVKAKIVAQKADLDAFKTALQGKLDKMKAIREEESAVKKDVQSQKVELQKILGALKDGTKTLPADQLNQLLALADALKQDSKKVIDSTAAQAAPAAEINTDVKQSRYTNALSSLDKVIAKMQSRLDALKDLQKHLGEMLVIARQAVDVQPAQTTPAEPTTPTTPTIPTEPTYPPTPSDTQTPVVTQPQA